MFEGGRGRDVDAPDERGHALTNRQRERVQRVEEPPEPPGKRKSHG